MPHSFLVGPDGRVRQKGARGPAREEYDVVQGCESDKLFQVDEKYLLQREESPLPLIQLCEQHVCTRERTVKMKGLKCDLGSEDPRKATELKELYGPPIVRQRHRIDTHAYRVNHAQYY